MKGKEITQYKINAIKCEKKSLANICSKIILEVVIMGSLGSLGGIVSKSNKGCPLITKNEMSEISPK